MRDGDFRCDVSVYVCVCVRVCVQLRILGGKSGREAEKAKVTFPRG